ncbi:hypothetical protein GCM10010287_40010 [Streptomyces variabilis]|uniref:Uncharacterized protein n=1 Tax=Streptomyces variabilis TaxID=67372 RepID=A0ABQ2U0X8_9ACTN|nr:hypothetical protein GCM10010265_49340 [Streptomyces griseoincarnatus]GGT61497.1 hypothetical protein GCM10010287_40010 [Streptomyces variabilis]
MQAPHGYCVCVAICTPSVFPLDSYSACPVYIGHTLNSKTARPPPAVDGLAVVEVRRRLG